MSLWTLRFYEASIYQCTLLETNMETQKGPYKDYSLSEAIWVSMLVWRSVDPSALRPDLLESLGVQEER